MKTLSTQESPQKRSDVYRHVCHFCGDRWDSLSYHSNCKKCETLGELQLNLHILERAEKYAWEISEPEVQAMARYIRELQLD